jgi:aspartate carbamoyltransferase regulatory subunit
MLEITSIKNGYVLDHIKAGSGIKIFRYLNLGQKENTVALIINAKSNKNGKKDMIKIENIIDLDLTVLSLLSPGITVNKVKNEVIEEKINPKLPKCVKEIIKCGNPNCITSQEKYLEHVFEIVNEEEGSYKCQYCDTIVNLSEV